MLQLLFLVVPSFLGFYDFHCELTVLKTLPVGIWGDPEIKVGLSREDLHLLLPALQALRTPLH